MVAYRILIPGPAQSLGHWTTREVSLKHLLISNPRPIKSGLGVRHRFEQTSRFPRWF